MKYCKWINVSENFAVSLIRFDAGEGRCIVSLKCYPPTRLHGVTTQKTVISVLSFFLRIVHSNGWSNNDCKGSDSCMFGRRV